MKYTFAVFCLSFLLPSTLLAQWVQTSGPEGGNITHIVTTPSAIVVHASGAGIYRSTDHGVSWTLTDPSQPGVFSMLAIGDTIFEGRLDSIYCSTDAGLTWFPRSNGLPGDRHESIESIILSEGNLFATFNLNTDFPAPIPIYRSTDRGMHWDSISAIPQAFNGAFGSTSVLADVSGNLLTASDSSIFRSTDHGLSWLWSGNGIPVGILGIAGFAVKGDTVAAAGLYQTGLLLSTDGGVNWHREITGTLLDSGVAGCFWNGNELLAGSADGGIFRLSNGAWTKVDSTPYVHAFVRSGSGTLVAGSSSDGIIRSTDNGSSWLLSNDNLYADNINDLETIGTDIFAAAGNGLFQSDDEGLSWQRVLRSSISGSAVAFGGISLLATDGVHALAANEDKMFRSTNGGQSWAASSSPQPGGQIISAAITGSLALASSQLSVLKAGGVFETLEWDSLYRSTDAGGTWQVLTNAPFGLGITYNMVAIYGDTMFAVQLSDSVILRSTDQGSSWVGDTLPFNGFGFVNSIAHVGSRLFVAGSSLWSSSDGGNHWEVVPMSGLSFPPSKIFGIGPNLFGLTTGGISRSTDFGHTWSQFGTGLENVGVTSVAALNNYLLAGTQYNSVWRRPLSENSVTGPTEVSRAVTISNAPNPFSDATTVSYYIPEQDFVRIELFDALGRHLLTMYSGNESIGTHSLPLRAGTLPDGTYFCRIIAGNASATGCMIKSEQ